MTNITPLDVKLANVEKGNLITLDTRATGVYTSGPNKHSYSNNKLPQISQFDAPAISCK